MFSYVIIDESMLPWFGPRWREVSVFNQYSWIRQMLLERNIHVIVIHSWTKIFCCTGLRIGSIILPCKFVLSQSHSNSANEAFN